jgi:hypothetical protein
VNLPLTKTACPQPSLLPTPTLVSEVTDKAAEMTGVDLEKCKRIVQYFWDPEPKNDTAPETPIWCLGQQYTPTQPTDSHGTGM